MSILDPLLLLLYAFNWAIKYQFLVPSSCYGDQKAANHAAEDQLLKLKPSHAYATISYHTFPSVKILPKGTLIISFYESILHNVPFEFDCHLCEKEREAI